MSEWTENATAAATAKGLVVVVPKANELFVDIDDEESRTLFEARIGIVVDVIPCTWVMRPSPSGLPGHFHVTVTLPLEVTAIERIALQACLGSDRLHELLSWRALMRGSSMPTLFFERPPSDAVPERKAAP